MNIYILIALSGCGASLLAIFEGPWSKNITTFLSQRALGMRPVKESNSSNE